jgi:hypothetical protein
VLAHDLFRAQSGAHQRREENGRVMLRFGRQRRC